MNQTDSVLGADLVIIIGAPRSGTNMLRDVITRFDECGTWPCDEINYILRHKNIRFESDEFPLELARESVKKYLRKSFSDFANKQGINILIEKTCANSLRIPFLNEVFPQAKYIFIFRDGLDVAASASIRWTAKLELGYVIKKLQFVPFVDIPYYGVRYFFSRLYRFFSKNKRVAFWGPVLNNMHSILNSYSLNEVCAIQWQKCIEKADQGLSGIDSDRVCRVSYEKFVKAPSNELERILKFIRVDTQKSEISKAVKNISNKSLGKGRIALGAKEVKKLESLVGTTLKKYGYL